MESSHRWSIVSWLIQNHGSFQIGHGLAVQSLRTKSLFRCAREAFNDLALQPTVIIAGSCISFMCFVLASTRILLRFDWASRSFEIGTRKSVLRWLVGVIAERALRGHSSRSWLG